MAGGRRTRRGPQIKKLVVASNPELKRINSGIDSYIGMYNRRALGLDSRLKEMDYADRVEREVLRRIIESKAKRLGLTVEYRKSGLAGIVEKNR